MYLHALQYLLLECLALPSPLRRSRRRTLCRPAAAIGPGGLFPDVATVCLGGGGLLLPTNRSLFSPPPLLVTVLDDGPRIGVIGLLML